MKANYLASNAPPDMSARDWLRMLQTGLTDQKGAGQGAPEPAGTEVILKSIKGCSIRVA